MTEPADKTGSHGSWANKISLTTLLVIVFGIGGAFVEARFTRKAVDDLAQSMKEHAAASNARVKNLEDWRIQHEAVSAPLMNDYIQDRKERSERKRR